MARFLSAEWFEQLHGDEGLPVPSSLGPAGSPDDLESAGPGGTGSVATGAGGTGEPRTVGADSFPAGGASPGSRGSEAGAAVAPIALEISVPDAPGGEVRYQIVVEGARVRARWRREELGAADVSFTTDYGTISGIAAGRMAAVEALAKGKAQVSGNTALLARFAVAVDLVPAPVRATTTF